MPVRSPTIGFLACESTLPLPEGTLDKTARERRSDAFEHDLMIAAVEPALSARDIALQVIDWEAPLEDFAGISLILLGTAWNYFEKSEAFLAKLEALSDAGIAVHNAPDIVRWNIAKTYLKSLSEAGALTIPTLWLDQLNAADAASALDHFGCETLVVKRQIGAGAIGQEMLQRGAIKPDWTYSQPAMVQPFLPAIAEEGELSFIFIDGALSHALVKRAAPGDYRIQSMYGGSESTHHPNPAEQASAHTILEALPFAEPPLYARIDMLRMHNGALAVMEAELIEPYLYPEQGPKLGEHLARAIAKRV